MQARVISTQGRESMRPPQGHIIIASEREEVEAVRGPARIVRRLEFYKTFYGPVVRLALSVYPMEGEPLSAGTALNISQVSGDTALTGLGRQKTIYIHFYSAVATTSRTRSPRRSPTPPSNAARRRRCSRWPATPIRDPRGAQELQRPSGSPKGSSSFLYLNLTKKDSLRRRARVYCHVCKRGARDDFVAKISQAIEGAGRRGIHVTAGAGSCDLEAQQFDRRLPEEDEPFPTGRPHHLESPVGSRDLGGHEGISRLCYFLDGVQSSREIGRIGMSPVIVSTVAATIVNRCGRRFSRMPLESPPVVVQAVILPRSAGDQGVDTFWDLLLAAGFSELDPEEVPSSSHLVLDSAEYIADADPSDYVGMREGTREGKVAKGAAGGRAAQAVGG